MLQTDWQAMNKSTGSGKPLGRRALLGHVATYMVAFIPALVVDRRARPVAWRAVSVGALVAIPHLLVDDGTLVRIWLRGVKGTTGPRSGSA